MSSSNKKVHGNNEDTRPNFLFLDYVLRRVKAAIYALSSCLGDSDGVIVHAHFLAFRFFLGGSRGICLGIRIHFVTKGNSKIASTVYVKPFGRGINLGRSPPNKPQHYRLCDCSRRPQPKFRIRFSPRDSEGTFYVYHRHSRLQCRRYSQMVFVHRPLYLHSHSSSGHCKPRQLLDLHNITETISYLRNTR